MEQRENADTAPVGAVSHTRLVVPRPRRTRHGRTFLACAYVAYLLLFAAGLLGVASLVLPTGVAALVALALAVVAIVAGAGVWAIAARRRGVATVSELPPAPMVSRAEAPAPDASRIDAG